MNYEMKGDIDKRLRALKRNEVRFVSGTTPPADSDIEANDIESLEKGLAYFKEKGVRRLLLQPKWMGSRCQYYMNIDPAKDKLVSRNGYPVRISDEHKAEIRSQWIHLFHNLAHVDAEYNYKVVDEEVVAEAIPETVKPVEQIFLDAELLPWAAIGKGLIDREFHGVVDCVETENQFLLDKGFPQAKKEMQGDALYIQYILGMSTLTKEQILKAFPKHETYNNFLSIFKYSIDEELEDLALFKKQLELYGRDAPVQLKAFDILRIDYVDGTSKSNYGNIGIRYMQLISKYPSIEYPWVINLKFDTGLKDAKLYEEMLTEAGYEGMILRPLDEYTDAIPYMKVRNKEYLRLIYGYNYSRPGKLEQLVAKKRTGKKRKIAHAEYKYGREMIALDPNAADYDEKFEIVAKKLLFNIEEEASLDSRL